MKGNGLYLAPHPHFVEGDGLFLKHGNDISDDAGLLMGKNSLFKNIPIFGWLLSLFICRRDVYKSIMLCLYSLSMTLQVMQHTRTKYSQSWQVMQLQVKV